jgi:hypothetical protein
MNENHALAVLKDLLEERGVPLWLTDFALNREYVYATLKKARCKCPRAGRKNAYHDPGCLLGRLLLAAGGPVEVEIQRNLAHDLAFRESSEYWKRYWTEEMSDAVARLRQGEFRSGQRRVHDPLAFDSKVISGLKHAGVIETDHNGWIRIPRSINACGQCTAVGPMPHYPGCYGGP